MTAKPKLTNRMTLQHAILAVADGNDDAMQVLFEALRTHEKIDPSGHKGPFSALVAFDQKAVHGVRVFRLYKDVCQSDIVKTMACLRAVGLNILREKDLNAAIDGYKSINADNIVALVRVKLNGFEGAKPTPPKQSGGFNR